MRVTYRSRRGELSTGQWDVDRVHARIRALGEQATATFEAWRLPARRHRLRRRAGHLLGAVHPRRVAAERSPLCERAGARNVAREP